MESNKRQKCCVCKMNLTLDKFKKKRDDTYQKTCEECLVKRRANVKKYRCEHGRQRSRCKKCGGSEICEHGRLSNICKECGGSQICEHGNRRNRCKECGGSQMCEHGRRRSDCKECSDPVKITITNMITGSKKSDKKHDRYDPVNFVDRCFVGNLLDDYPHCYYEDCKCELQLIKYQDNLATIKRLDNSIGHIKGNCVICCMKCNRMKKSNK